MNKLRQIARYFYHSTKENGNNIIEFSSNLKYLRDYARKSGKNTWQIYDSELDKVVYRVKNSEVVLNEL